MRHKKTNRLIHETSPYLLQHAHNPVDWYPWGKKLSLDPRKKTNPFSSASATPRAIGACDGKGIFRKMKRSQKS